MHWRRTAQKRFGFSREGAKIEVLAGGSSSLYYMYDYYIAIQLTFQQNLLEKNSCEKLIPIPRATACCWESASTTVLTGEKAVNIQLSETKFKLHHEMEFVYIWKQHKHCKKYLITGTV